MKVVNEMMNDKWIGIEEAAEYVGVNAATEIHKRGICLEEYPGETN